MKRVLTITLILAVVIGTSVAGYYYLRPAEPQSLAEDPNIEIVQTELETLVDTVSATGRIEPGLPTVRAREPRARAGHRSTTACRG